MLYLHDVWVNWFEGEENGYNVCYFHEWRKEDGIELLDQVPLLYINETLYDYIENDMHDLPKPMLDCIYKRAYIRKGQERTVLDYACIVTDGSDVIALDTIGYQIPIRKSRLIPRQEQLVFDMIENTKKQSFKFDENLYQKEYHMLSMPPELIYGLTRRERQLKQLLMMALDQLHTANNLEELRYWLTEWNPKKYPFIRYMDEEKVWQALYNGVKYGWSNAHEELCGKLIKGQPFLEKMWELEQNQEQQNTSKLR
ncbi:YjbA family protein [Lentibacillus sp. Marseille-P4043]|uniref:YjbA family protein n=1 Tax=Lentibacillus sp. Marseille-P4043 TaxID=2040293 RepID=UPI000D0BD6C2|nr:YjbA family protein [Lentibacillus sp. Marseille-P4043]